METRKAPMYKKGPWWARARAFFTDPLNFSVNNAAELGPVFETPVPFRRVFVVSGPEEIQKVLQSNHKNYHKSPFYNALKLALGNGLLNSEGNYWKQQRKLMQPVFYKSALHGLYLDMKSETENYMEWLKMELTQNAHFDLAKETMRITASIVLQSLFSSDAPLSRDEMYKMMVELQEYVMMRALSPQKFPLALLKGQHHRFLKYRRKIDDALYQMIDKRAKETDPPHDLLSMLTFARDAETDEGMPREAIRDELITLFAAGHETTANALAWIFRLLAANPEKEAILQKEIQTVLGARLPEMADFKDMPYTRAVIEEGMRLYPPAYAVGRLAIHDDEVGGFHIPKKSIMFLSIYALHRNPEIWEDPNSFRPERFLPDAPAIPRNAYMPFGFGPRKCIGYQFAMMEMQLLVPAFLQNVHFTFPEKWPEPQTLITLRPKGGMKVVINRRM
ncbi:MAG: cytochrome P450 [Bacteroidetes bacterium]|nr:cytochrome P450 [Bacteroidota bacterium]